MQTPLHNEQVGFALYRFH